MSHNIHWVTCSLTINMDMAVYFESVPHTTPVTVNTHMWTKSLAENCTQHAHNLLFFKYCLLPHYTFIALVGASSLGAVFVIWLVKKEVLVTVIKFKHKSYLLRKDLWHLASHGTQITMTWVRVICTTLHSAMTPKTNVLLHSCLDLKIPMQMYFHWRLNKSQVNHIQILKGTVWSGWNSRQLGSTCIWRPGNETRLSKGDF